MPLATLLLPSSVSTPTAGDHRTHSRRHDHHHGSKRKKKPPPPPSPQPSLPLAPRTPPPPGAPSPKVRAAGKNNHAQYQYQQRRGQPTKNRAAAASSSWEQVKSLLSCRTATAAARVHDPSALARLRGASLCAMRDVVLSSASGDRDTAPLNRRRAPSSSAASGAGSSSHHSSLRGLSGCYECRAIDVEPMSRSVRFRPINLFLKQITMINARLTITRRRYPRPRELCACPQCGEVFTMADSLEHHQAIRHAGIVYAP
jgi:rubredoxin